MTTQTAPALIPVAGSNAAKMSDDSCGIGQKSGRMKWLIGAAATLLIVGLVTGSAVFGFAAIVPLLYVLPCLVMCSMCLFKQCGAEKS